MITSLPTEAMQDEWKSVFEKYKNIIKPNRISGGELLDYLNDRYVLTPIEDENAKAVVRDNVLMNERFKEKLPVGELPNPQTFFLENKGSGRKFYHEKSDELWGGEITRIFVGIDIASGFYTVEGSTLLFDELNAVLGLDERDLQNFVIVAQYVEALEKFDMMDRIAAR